MPRQVLHRPGHAHSTMLRLLVTVCLGAFVVAVIALTGSGLLLEGPQPPLERADAIVVISGDESQARLSEGVRLFRAGLHPTSPTTSGPVWGDGHRMISSPTSSPVITI